MSDGLLLLIVALPLLLGELAALVDAAALRRDLAGPRRLLWIVLLLVAPYVSLAAYWIVRPRRGIGIRGTGRADGREGNRRAAELVRAAERQVWGGPGTVDH